MTLFVCPHCEVLYETYSYLSKHVICNKCGIETGLYPQYDWPMNYIQALLNQIELEKDCQMVMSHAKAPKAARMHLQKIRDIHIRINKLCKDYGIAINRGLE